MLTELSPSARAAPQVHIVIMEPVSQPDPRISSIGAEYRVGGRPSRRRAVAPAAEATR